MKLSQCKLKVLQRKEKWNCYFAIELCRMKCWLVLCLRGATFSNYISHHCVHIWGENSWWWQRITRIISQLFSRGFSTRVKVYHANDKIFSETVKIWPKLSRVACEKIFYLPRKSSNIIHVMDLEDITDLNSKANQ